MGEGRVWGGRGHLGDSAREMAAHFGRSMHSLFPARCSGVIASRGIGKERERVWGRKKRMLAEHFMIFATVSLSELCRAERERFA